MSDFQPGDKVIAGNLGTGMFHGPWLGDGPGIACVCIGETTFRVPFEALTLVARATYEPVEPLAPVAPVFDPEPGTLYRADGGGVWHCFRDNGNVYVRPLLVYASMAHNSAAMRNPRPVVPVDADAIEKGRGLLAHYDGPAPMHGAALHLAAALRAILGERK